MINYSPEVYLLSEFDSQNPLDKDFSLIYSMSSLGITFPEDSTICQLGSFIEVLHSLPLYVDRCENSNEENVIYPILHSMVIRDSQS
jgi:hypothetical protein